MNRKENEGERVIQVPANVVKIAGVLEIQQGRGVIYFHSVKGFTALRIEGLPKPIPNPEETFELLDIIADKNVMIGWRELNCSVCGDICKWDATYNIWRHVRTHNHTAVVIFDEGRDF